MGLRLFYFQTKAIICSPVGHAYDAYGRTPVAPATPCPLHPTRAAGRMVEKIVISSPGEQGYGM